MSKTTPTVPEKYTPRQALRDREVLAAAIRDKIQRERIPTAEIGGLAGKVAGIPSLATAAEALASGLVAVAGLVGVAALAYAGYEWLKSRRTYEGVAA